MDPNNIDRPLSQASQFISPSIFDKGKDTELSFSRIISNLCSKITVTFNQIVNSFSSGWVNDNDFKRQLEKDINGLNQKVRNLRSELNEAKREIDVNNVKSNIIRWEVAIENMKEALDVLKSTGRKHINLGQLLDNLQRDVEDLSIPLAKADSLKKHIPIVTSSNVSSQKELELKSAQNEIAALKNKLANSEGLISDLTQESAALRDQLQQKLFEVEKSLESHKSKHPSKSESQEADSQLKAAEAHVKELSSKLEAAKTKKSGLKEKVGALEAQLQNIKDRNDEVHKLEAKVAKSEQSVEELTQKIIETQGKLQAKLNIAEATVMAQNKVYPQHEAEIEDLKKRLEDANSKLEAAESKISQLNQNLEKTKTEAGTKIIVEQIGLRDEEKSNLEKEIKNLKEQLSLYLSPQKETLRLSLSFSEELVKLREKELKEARKEIESMKSRDGDYKITNKKSLELAESKIESLEAELAASQKEKSELEKINKSLLGAGEVSVLKTYEPVDAKAKVQDQFTVKMLTSLAKAVQEKDEQIKGLGKEIEEKQVIIESLTLSAAEKGKKPKISKEELSQFQAKVNSLESELAAVQKEKEALEKDKEKLKSDLNAETERITKALKEESTSEAANLLKQIDSLRNQLHTNESLLQESKSQLANATTLFVYQRKALQADRDNLKTRLEKMSASQNAEIERLNKALMEEKPPEAKKFVEQINELKAELTSKEQELKRAESDYLNEVKILDQKQTEISAELKVIKDAKTFDKMKSALTANIERTVKKQGLAEARQNELEKQFTEALEGRTVKSMTDTGKLTGQGMKRAVNPPKTPQELKKEAQDEAEHMKMKTEEAQRRRRIELEPKIAKSRREISLKFSNLIESIYEQPERMGKNIFAHLQDEFSRPHNAQEFSGILWDIYPILFDVYRTAEMPEVLQNRISDIVKEINKLEELETGHPPREEIPQLKAKEEIEQKVEELNPSIEKKAEAKERKNAEQPVKIPLTMGDALERKLIDEEARKFKMQIVPFREFSAEEAVGKYQREVEDLSAMDLEIENQASIVPKSHEEIFSEISELLKAWALIPGFIELKSKLTVPQNAEEVRNLYQKIQNTIASYYSPEDVPVALNFDMRELNNDLTRLESHLKFEEETELWRMEQEEAQGSHRAEQAPRIALMVQEYNQRIASKFTAFMESIYKEPGGLPLGMNFLNGYHAEVLNKEHNSKELKTILDKSENILREAYKETQIPSALIIKLEDINIEINNLHKLESEGLPREEIPQLKTKEEFEQKFKELKELEEARGKRNDEIVKKEYLGKLGSKDDIKVRDDKGAKFKKIQLKKGFYEAEDLASLKKASGALKSSLTNLGLFLEKYPAFQNSLNDFIGNEALSVYQATVRGQGKIKSETLISQTNDFLNAAETLLVYSGLARRERDGSLSAEDKIINQLANAYDALSHFKELKEKPTKPLIKEFSANKAVKDSPQVKQEAETPSHLDLAAIKAKQKIDDHFKSVASSNKLDPLTKEKTIKQEPKEHLTEVIVTKFTDFMEAVRKQKGITRGMDVLGELHREVLNQTLNSTQLYEVLDRTEEVLPDGYREEKGVPLPLITFLVEIRKEIDKLREIEGCNRAIKSDFSKLIDYLARDEDIMKFLNLSELRSLDKEINAKDYSSPDLRKLYEKVESMVVEAYGKGRVSSISLWKGVRIPDKVSEFMIAIDTAIREMT